MDSLIQIGAVELDLLHLIFFLAALGFGLALYQIWQKWTEAADLAEQVRIDLDATEQRLETQRLIAEEERLKLAELRGQTTRQREEFQEMAQGVIEKSQSRFLDLAKQSFEKHHEGAKGELKQMMQPIGENFTEFKKKVDAIEKVRVADKSAIQEQVKAIGESLHRNTTETGKLVNALTAPKGGGRWGEMTLRNVMEQAGLSGHCDFNEQVHDTTETGFQRPDAVIYLPGERQIVVDSKVSLDAYMAANSAESEEHRGAHLKAHAASVQRHIDALASKRYQANLDERVDFVAMFIPGENFFAAALEHSPELLERAYAKNIIVTTPSTLIGLAKTVAYVWRQEKMTENAREAAQLGQALYERMSKMTEHMTNLGKSLNKAVENYNRMNGSFDKRVLPTLRKFKDLSIAPPDKALPDNNPIEARAETSSATQLELIEKAS